MIRRPTAPRGLIAALAAAGMLMLMPALAAAQQGPPGNFQASLSPMNDSGAQGTATMSLDGNQLTVNIQSTGLVPGAPHAQHLHGTAGSQSRCPQQNADTDGDGIVNTAEGQPAYGSVQVSLTTEGGTGADSALAVERFPTADDSGNLTYSRTFEVSDEVVENLGNWAVVQHGIDKNGNGTYDAEAGQSSLDESLPLEATAPANCGRITVAGQSGQAAVAPQGGVAAGFGGSATDTAGQALVVSLAMLTGLAAGGVFLRRRFGSAS